MIQLKNDVMVKHVTITAKRNGKGKLKATWNIVNSDDSTEECFKVYRNMGELRKEMEEMKTHCIKRGMKPDQFTIQNFYN